MFLCVCAVLPYFIIIWAVIYSRSAQIRGKGFSFLWKIRNMFETGGGFRGGERKRFPNEYKYALYNVVNVINSLAGASE